jgi:hypothetical protein
MGTAATHAALELFLPPRSNDLKPGLAKPLYDQPGGLDLLPMMLRHHRRAADELGQ